MDTSKLFSRYVLLTLFILIINHFKLTFRGIIMIKTLCFILLCFYLDYCVPRINSIKYYEESKTKPSPRYNPLTRGVIVNVLTNFCIYVGCLWLTMNNIHPDTNYQSMGLNVIMINYLFSIPLSLLSSALFYYIHRLFHTKYLYGLHKSHHIYNNPSSCVGLYGSVPDFVLSNCLSIFIPHLILRTHPYFVAGYTFIAVCDIFVNHTSYYFENKRMNNIFGGSYFHFIHHAKYKYNYGLNNKLLDKLHGTCDETNLSNYEIY